MKIVLTGASGIIGKVLTQMLIAEGHELTIFSQSPEKTQNMLPGASEYVQWSSDDETGFEMYMEGSDAVMHLAGTSIFGKLWNEDYREQILTSRENGTRNIVNAINRLDRKPHTFISASAIGIYGFSDSQTYTESTPPGEGFLAEVSKRWETEASGIDDPSIRTVKVRVGVVLDNDEGALAKIMTPFKFFLGGTVGDGSQWISWIHNRDAARIFIKALNDERLEGPVNAVAPNPVRMKEFAELLGSILNRPALLRFPKLPLRAALEDASVPVTEGIKVFPQKLTDIGFRFEYEHLKDALRNLMD